MWGFGVPHSPPPNIRFPQSPLILHIPMAVHNNILEAFNIRGGAGFMLREGIIRGCRVTLRVDAEPASPDGSSAGTPTPQKSKTRNRSALNTNLMNPTTQEQES